MSKQDSLNKLFDYREQIEKILTDIQHELQSNFPDEYGISYQHWIPQIKTSLRDDTIWLPRGQYSMDYTISRIQDKLNNDRNKGVTKYIK